MSNTSLINTQFGSTSRSGNARFSGIASGIDFQSAIDSIIAARRAPAVQLEAKMNVNTQKVRSYSQLSTLAATFKTQVDKLKGSTSFFADDVFKRRASFNTTRANVGAPVSHVPSSAASIASVTPANGAPVGKYTLRVTQLAQAHQIRADSVSSTSASLSSLGKTTGDFTINGQTITVDSDDTLLDLRDKINATSAANVTATVISSSATNHYLVVTQKTSGAANTVDFGATSATSDSLGLTAAGTHKTQLIANQNALFDLNGITGISKASNTITDVLDKVTITLFKAEADTVMDISIENDLTTIKSTIADFATAYNNLRDFYELQRLEAIRDSNGNIITDPAQQVDENGEQKSSSFGALAFDANMRQVMSRMSDLVTQRIPGLETDGFQGLSQIGVVLGDDYKLTVNDATLDAKLLANIEAVRKIFTFNFSSSDSRVTYLSHTENTNYNTNATTNAVEPFYLNIQGVDSSGVVTGANLQTASGSGGGGASDGSTTIDGKIITAHSSSTANGLKLLFNGANSSGAVADISITFTRGVADQLAFYLDGLTKFEGTFESTNNALTTDNVNLTNRVTLIDERLARQRAMLERQYIAMESALSQFNSLRNSITQFSQAGQNN